MDRGLPDWTFPYSLWAGGVKRVADDEIVAAGADLELWDLAGRGQVLGGILYLACVGGAVGTSSFRVTIDGQIVFGMLIQDYDNYSLIQPHTALLYLLCYDTTNNIHTLGITPFITFDSQFKILFRNRAAVNIVCTWDCQYSLVQA